MLRAAHIRELDELRRRASPRKLLAVVLPASVEYLAQRARAEMVAALRVIDYVVIADDADRTGSPISSSPWKSCVWKQPIPGAPAS